MREAQIGMPEGGFPLRRGNSKPHHGGPESGWACRAEATRRQVREHGKGAGSNRAQSLLGYIALTLAFSGCKLPDQTTIVPVIETPENWIAGGVPEKVGLDWWTSFESPALDAVVHETLKNNRDLLAAAARVEAAAAQARIAGADLIPSLSGTTDARRNKQNFVGLPIPGGGNVLTTHASSFNLTFITSWELDLWGRIRAGKRAANQELSARLADLRGARQSLAAQAAKAWIATLEAQRQLELTQKTIQSHRATEVQVKRRYEEGLRSSLDLRLASAGVANAEAMLEARTQALETATRRMEILMGRYPSGKRAADAILPGVSATIPAGLPADLLARRPDLVAAGLRLLAADSRIAGAKAALLPRISLTAQGGTATAELSDLLSSDFTVWTLAGNLAQPILDGGRLRAGVKLTNARAQQAAAAFESAALQAFGEVETALASEATLARREERLLIALSHARAAHELASGRYGEGLESFAIVLETQRQLLATESQALAAQAQRLGNRVNLHLALGGGFDPASGPIDTSDKNAKE